MLTPCARNADILLLLPPLPLLPLLLPPLLLLLRCRVVVLQVRTPVWQQLLQRCEQARQRRQAGLKREAKRLL
jgi:hypothetical protein